MSGALAKFVMMASLLVCVTASPAWCEAAAPFEVFFDASLEPTSELALLVSGGDRAGDQTEALVLRVDKRGRGHIQLPETEGPLQLSCAAPEHWCSARLTGDSDGDPGQAVRLEVLPAGVIEGQPKTEASGETELPQHVLVQAWGSERQGISFVETVAIEEASFRLKVPAVPLDLRLAFEGWAPAYFWDFKAEAGADTALGALQLRKGASLCGFVVDEGTGLPLVGAQVSLGAPEPQPGISAKDYARLMRLRWQATTNERGFFQIASAAEGEFRLELTQPLLAGNAVANAEEGAATGDQKAGTVQAAPFVIEPVTLTASAETCLDDIFFPVAHEVIFAVTPPQTPDQRPWQLALAQAHSSMRQPVAAETDELGLAHISVQGGDYRVTIRDGNGARITRQTVSVEGPGEIALDLDLVAVRGSLNLAGEPILGEIRLAGDKIDATFTSDSDGQFGGLMRAPRGGQLVAHVKSAYPAFSRWIELGEQEGEDGVLVLEIDFQDRSIEGVVRDEAGQPLRRAQVVAMQKAGFSADVYSEVDGQFRVDGLGPGSYEVWASLDDYGASESREIVISDVELDSDESGSGVSGVELIILPGLTRSGRLIDSNGQPVAGARMTISFPGQSGWLESSSTGVDGRFDFRAPPVASQALITSEAVSVGLLWSTCAQLAEEVETLLQLPPAPGGTLLLTMPEAFSFGSQLVVSTSDGGLLTSGELGRWATRRGVSQTDGMIQVPDVASGLYSARRMRGAARDMGCGSSLGGDWHPLAPGGELALKSSRPTAGRW